MDQESLQSEHNMMVLPHVSSLRKIVSTKSATSAIKFPHRELSVVVPPKQLQYITADKTTCKDCPCFKIEAPYETPAKIRMCQFTPRTLYELASMAVDKLEYPRALFWSPLEVGNWVSNVVGLPQYAEFFIRNKIDGRKLLAFEDPSLLPSTGIRDYLEIKNISEKVRREFGTEFIKFTRSIGLPPRKPLTHCTWFKSGTAPLHSERHNITRSDVLRLMQIINPAPQYMSHWDLIWYIKPEYPKTKFGRVKHGGSREQIPHYTPRVDRCYEAVVPRKFQIQANITPSNQFIWVDTRKYNIKPKKPLTKDTAEKSKKKKPKTVPIDTRLFPKKISSAGLRGAELALARRLQPRQKFFPTLKFLPDEVTKKRSDISLNIGKTETYVVFKAKK